MLTVDARNGPAAGPRDWPGDFESRECLSVQHSDAITTEKCLSTNGVPVRTFWFLPILNASTPLPCSIYCDLNPSLCFLCESPLSQACIINVRSDLPPLSKCNQHQGTRTTCSYSFVRGVVHRRPRLLLFSASLSGNQGHGASRGRPGCLAQSVARERERERAELLERRIAEA